MRQIAIRADGLSKRYLLGHQRGRGRYVALRDVLTDKMRRLLPRTSNLKTDELVLQRDELKEFWALRDVSFELQHGEVLAVIGRNGAGKSTLLKVLSRITEPSAGRAILNGRVASLLEVGTGFHPELTGRENIFLNGAILGMKRHEIKLRFDDIVEFAEVQRFLDTPVKRYSSGMYVRLAFAVAAHLNPEILIVDEVLAVGDAEFQKKCLGKMGEVARGGRTILFVSHNMAAVKSLTNRGILLDKGELIYSGSTDDAVAAYTKLMDRSGSAVEHDWGRGTHTAIRRVRLMNDEGRSSSHYEIERELRLEIELETDGAPGLSLEFFLVDATRAKLAMASTYQFQGVSIPERRGSYRIELRFAPLHLASGRYSVDVFTSVINIEWDHIVESAVDFDVHFSNPLGRPWDFKQSYGYGCFSLTSVCQPEFVAL